MSMTRSSGDVFRDLGFAPEEAANLRVRSMLMIEIEKYVRAKGLTKKAAANRFAVTHPRISDLMRGKIGLFSVETLIAMLTHAGLTVDGKVRRTAA
jgi:predicted XRE-type DNA-binding protein